MSICGVVLGASVRVVQSSKGCSYLMMSTLTQTVLRERGRRAREMRLPYSHCACGIPASTIASWSAARKRWGPTTKSLPTWAEYRAGRDPVLEWILEYSDAPGSGR